MPFDPAPGGRGSPGSRPTSSTILPPALGLAVVTAVNVLITSRVVEHFQGRHRPLRPSDADAELGAYGIANLCAGAFGAPISVGIPARSVANVRCGGSTRMSNLLHAVVLLGLVRFGSGLIAMVPLAALAGVTRTSASASWSGAPGTGCPGCGGPTRPPSCATAVAVVAANAIAAVAIGCALHAAGDLVARSNLAAARSCSGSRACPGCRARRGGFLIPRCLFLRRDRPLAARPRARRAAVAVLMGRDQPALQALQIVRAELADVPRQSRARAAARASG